MVLLVLVLVLVLVLLVLWLMLAGYFNTIQSCLCPCVCQVYNVAKDPFEYNRAALQLRARLIPYIYTRVWHAPDAGG